MATFERLKLKNFKRFSGNHDFPLSGFGQMTVIAAQNGVGKTTLLDSIYVCLYGKRGFDGRYPNITFKKWLANAYSVDAPKSQFPEILFSIDINCPIRGKITISRKFWLLDEKDGGITEELLVSIESKPLELEQNEKRNEVSERWIEAFLPYSVMKRFLVDGERLSDLDTRSVDKELIKGIDDLLGIGVLQRLSKHLKTLKRESLRKMAPQEQKIKMEELINLSNTYTDELEEITIKLEKIGENISEMEVEMENLNRQIKNFSSDSGDKDNQLRIEWVKKHSELNSVRSSLLEISNTTLPFIIASLPSDISEWKINDVRDKREQEKRNIDNINFIDKVLSELKPKPKSEIIIKIKDKAEELTFSHEKKKINSPLSGFNSNQLSKIEKRYIELNIVEQKPMLKETVELAIKRLKKLDNIEEKLRDLSNGIGITEAANQLKECAMSLGGLQAESTKLREQMKKKNEGLKQIEQQILAIKSKSDKKSLLNRKIDTIDILNQIIETVMNRERRLMAEPLSKMFFEGFELLSRKAERLEKVSIDPVNYQTIIKMRGFEGNWLNRDLSATEKQHVGLALLYALRKLGNKAYPVIVDTPTSRMDKDHKGWSVTRFYPSLSHQVIVLATSDDLGNGLYQELKSTNSLGCELHLKEKTENSVIIDETNLSNFFGK